MGIDRSQQSRGVHVDEIIGTKTIKADLKKLQQQVNQGNTPTNQTLTGVPQPGTPYLVATRVNDEGKVIATVRYTSLATTLRHFRVWHRLVKSDGTYGEPVEQVIKPSAAEIAANSVEREIQKPWHPNRNVNLVLIEAKLTDDPTNDGGSHDQNPPNYAPSPSPNGTQLATFSTGAAQPGIQAFNDGLNTSFVWGQADWGDTNGTGTHDNHRLARWRYGFGSFVSGWNIDSSIGDQTTGSVSSNYWSSAQHIHVSGATIPAGCLLMQTGGIIATADPCVKLHHDPFDAEEPVEIMFLMYEPGLVRGGTALTGMDITIEDGVSGSFLANVFINVPALHLPVGQWSLVRAQATSVVPGYQQSPGAGQVARIHLQNSIGPSFKLIDKLLIGKMSGAYSKNPRDAQVTADTPTVLRTGSGRGKGYGTTGGEGPAGGQILRSSTE